MSVPVDVAALAEQIDAMFGAAYLVTAGADGAPHVVAVAPAWDGDELVVGAGRHTSANVEANGSVTLLWPAPPGRPYSLIVDGAGRLRSPDESLAIRPTRAVLHRVPEVDDSVPSCVVVMER